MIINENMIIIHKIVYLTAVDHTCISAAPLTFD